MNARNRITFASLLLLGGVMTLFMSLQPGCEARAQDIAPEELRQQLVHGDSTVVLLDVRTEEEYRGETGHLKGSLLIPVQELEARMGELEPYRGKTIVAYCRTGRRSARAAEMLRSEGFTALNMTGGIVRWNEQSFPVVREE